MVFLTAPPLISTRLFIKTPAIEFRPHPVPLWSHFNHMASEKNYFHYKITFPGTKDSDLDIWEKTHFNLCIYGTYTSNHSFVLLPKSYLWLWSSLVVTSSLMTDAFLNLLRVSEIWKFEAHKISFRDVQSCLITGKTKNVYNELCWKGIDWFGVVLSESGNHGL